MCRQTQTKSKSKHVLSFTITLSVSPPGRLLLLLPGLLIPLLSLQRHAMLLESQTEIK
jgi:hypothetical protein